MGLGMAPNGNSSSGVHKDKGAERWAVFKPFRAGQKLRQQLLPQKIAAWCSQAQCGAAILCTSVFITLFLFTPAKTISCDRWLPDSE
jgi:hypothetical protein